MSQATIQLYNLNSHTQSFQASVLTCVPKTLDNGHTNYIITLDSTAFFPEGGGQPYDTGTLGTAEVIEVKEDDGIIYHTLTSPLQVGQVVTGVINWERRFDLMRHHTGEHIISGLVNNYFGYDNVGFHMGTDVITIDFNGILTEADLNKIEYEANLAIYKNLPITVTYPSKEELCALNYRSKKELAGNVRIVSIEGYDVCACCAPHVTLTGEIGSIKIVSSQSYKGGVRVSILCGLRALRDYNKKQENVLAISSLLSAKPYEVKEAVKNLKDENTAIKGKLLDLQNQILKYKGDLLQTDSPTLWVFDDYIPLSSLRNFANQLLLKNVQVLGVFVKENDMDYKYILGSKTTDIRPLAANLNEIFNGKGGGSKEMVQGTLSGKKEELLEFLNSYNF